MRLAAQTKRGDTSARLVWQRPPQMSPVVQMVELPDGCALLLQQDGPPLPPRRTAPAHPFVRAAPARPQPARTCRASGTVRVCELDYEGLRASLQEWRTMLGLGGAEEEDGPLQITVASDRDKEARLPRRPWCARHVCTHTCALLSEDCPPRKGGLGLSYDFVP